MRFPYILFLGSLLGLSLSFAANSGAIVAPGDTVHGMDAFTSTGVLLGLTLPATVWIVLAGLGALVYLISHRP